MNIEHGMPNNDPHFEEIENLFKLDFPESYKEYMINNDCGYEINGDGVSVLLYSIRDVLEFHTDEGYSYVKDMPKMIFFSGDLGDDDFYFDPENYLGKGNWAVFRVGRGELNFEYSMFVADSFSDMINKVKDGNDLYHGGKFLKDEQIYSDKITFLNNLKKSIQ